MNSLTRTLTLLILGMVLLIALMAAWWSYIESNHELEELFDAELAQSSRIVQGLVRHLSATHTLAELAASLTETLQLPSGMFEEGSETILSDGVGHRYETKLAFEVWSPAGEPLLDTLYAVDELPLTSGFAWVKAGETSWRTFTLQDPSSGFWIRTAQRGDIRAELSRELALGNVLPLLLVLPLLVIAVILVIQWGFRPLRRLESSVSRMAPKAIHPLDLEHAPEEVTGLVRAVNGLLARLEQALVRERRFSADAAHELRTPLTVLRLNLEKACIEQPERFNGLSQSVERMVHLVEQMLLLGRVDAATTLRFESLDLSATVAQGIAELTPLALKRGIEPSLEDSTGMARVLGDETLLHAMLGSLMANAIQYAPSDSALTVYLDQVADGYRIRVCDQGPGIVVAERERAMERFVRLDQRLGSGAGLGLAIARRIVELHRGQLKLADRPDGQRGLCVEIMLPGEQAAARTNE